MVNQTDNQSNTHQGEALQRFVEDERLRIPEIAEALGLTRPRVYSLFKLPKIKDKHLRMLKERFGFNLVSVTKGTNETKPSNKVDTQPESVGTAKDKKRTVADFATEVFGMLLDIEDVKKTVLIHAAKLEDHDGQFDRMLDVTGRHNKDIEQIRKDIEELKQKGHVH